jgi:hypothetical protein
MNIHNKLEKDTYTLFSKFESRKTSVFEINKFDTIDVLIEKIATYSNIKREFIIKNCNIKCNGKYILLDDIHKQIKDISIIADMITIYIDVSLHKIQLLKPDDILGKSIASSIIKNTISTNTISHLIFSFGSFNISEKDIDKNIQQQFQPKIINSVHAKDITIILTDMEFGISDYSRQFYDYLSFIKDGLDDYLFPYHRNLIKFPSKVVKYTNYKMVNGCKKIIDINKICYDAICNEYEKKFNECIDSKNTFLTIYCLNWTLPRGSTRDKLMTELSIDTSYANYISLLNWDGNELV